MTFNIEESEGMDMRAWIKPELEELNLTQTQQGGTPSKEYDNVWEQDGRWYGTYEPGQES